MISPIISVCLATYNGEKYLKQQLESILSQINPDDEIVISDDASTDKTISIIESFNDKRITLLIRTTNHGLKNNFENAIKHAKGDYIFLSDQDDVWLDSKVSKTRQYLLNYDLVVSDCFLINGNHEVIQNSYYRLANSGKGVAKNIMYNTYLGCCMAFRKTLLPYILPFPDNIHYHDNWIGLISDIYGQVIFIESRLIYFRRHETTATSSGAKSSNSLFYKLVSRVILIFSLLKRIIAKSL